MTKLFISYRSLDSAKVDSIVARLRSLKNDDGTPQYDIWQDKYGILVGQDWWQAIVENIADSDVFVFMISRESVKNINCRAELSYARKRNRPIIPLVLEGEFSYNPVTGKNDVNYWQDMPEEINEGRFQFLFYEGVSFVKHLSSAVDRIESLNLRDLPASYPPDPRNANDSMNDASIIYDRACDYAWRLEFATAEKLFIRLVNWGDPRFTNDSHDWIVILRTYEEMVRFEQLENLRFRIPKLWKEYEKLFPTSFLKMFDPKNIGGQPNKSNPITNNHADSSVTIIPPSQSYLGGEVLAEEGSKYVDTTVKYDAPSVVLGGELNIEQRVNPELLVGAEAVRKIIGDPFDWCKVPEGEFLYGINNQKMTLPTFSMAKYPITNSQFQVFIGDKDGFHNKRWWAGLLRYQSDRPGDQEWEIADHPRENVSWYDTIAFCRWLSFKLGGGYAIDRISDWDVRLPTEFEWEKSARGSNGLIYPYGNTFDKNKANARGSKIGETTPVTTYPHGASFYGVMDLNGNVWEWCLSDYENPRRNAKDVNFSSNVHRSIRGGSWNAGSSDSRATFRYFNFPADRVNVIGFRLCSDAIRLLNR